MGFLLYLNRSLYVRKLKGNPPNWTQTANSKPFTTLSKLKLKVMTIHFKNIKITSSSGKISTVCCQMEMGFDAFQIFTCTCTVNCIPVFSPRTLVFLWSLDFIDEYGHVYIWSMTSHGRPHTHVYNSCHLFTLSFGGKQTNSLDVSWQALFFLCFDELAGILTDMDLHPWITFRGIFHQRLVRYCLCSFWLFTF